MKRQKNILTPEQLTQAYWTGKPIAVWQDGELLDYGGRIEKLTPRSVTVNGAKYLRATCTFTLRQHAY